MVIFYFHSHRANSIITTAGNFYIYQPTRLVINIDKHKAGKNMAGKLITRRQTNWKGETKFKMPEALID